MLANMSQNPILAEGLAEGQQGGQDNKGEQVAPEELDCWRQYNLPWWWKT